MTGLVRASMVACLCVIGCSSTPAGHSMFNGKDLTGFTVVGPAVWNVREGMIETYQDPAKPGGGYLVSEYKFRDFELLLKFKMVPRNGNSGVIIRDPSMGRDAPESSGLEIQILDRPDVPNRTGSIMGLAASIDPVVLPEWNEMRILAYREWVRVDVNGKRVCEAKAPAVTEGGIALQCYGSRRNLRNRAYFKDLMITPLFLPPPEFEEKVAAARDEDAGSMPFVIEQGAAREIEGEEKPAEPVESAPAPAPPPAPEPAQTPAPAPAPPPEPAPAPAPAPAPPPAPRKRATAPRPTPRRGAARRCSCRARPPPGGAPPAWQSNPGPWSPPFRAA